MSVGTAPAPVSLLVRRRTGWPPGAPWALTAGGALCALYAVLRPLSPDLSAQLARAAAASRGAGLWWAGWYGGLNTAPYSALSGALMGHLGVTTVGVVSTLVVCLACADLLRDAPHPRAGALAATAAACSNLYSGRVTYAAGMALALAACCVLVRGRPGPAAVLGALSGLFSPVAAMFLVLAVVPGVVRGPRARPVLVGAAAALPVLVVQVLSGQPSTMPYSPDLLVYGLLLALGVLASPVTPAVRAQAVVWAAAVLGCYVLASPVGPNVLRTPVLAAAALVVAYGRPTRRGHVLIALALAAWPVGDVVADLVLAAGPLSARSGYQALLQRLPAAGTSTQRVEVLDPPTHAGSLFVAPRVPLARGWERQVDVAANPLFYDGTLTADRYRDWLVAHAVGWVAVPASGPLDYGSTAERALLRTARPSFLRLVWQDERWLLYRVAVPAPAASSPLVVTALQDHAVAFAATGPGTGVLRVAWSGLLVAVDDADHAVTGCVRRSGPGAVTVRVPRAGRYHLVAELGGQACPAGSVSRPGSSAAR